MSSPNHYTTRIYEESDRERLIVFFNELQDHHIRLDLLGRMRRLEGYGEDTLDKTIKEVREKEGILLVAETDQEIVGFIVGIISSPVGEGILGTAPSRSGRVTELYTHESVRNQRVASLLMKEIEDYFIKENCKYAWADLFAPNTQAHRLYNKLGYNDRNIELVKTLK